MEDEMERKDKKIWARKRSRDNKVEEK